MKRFVPVIALGTFVAGVLVLASLGYLYLASGILGAGFILLYTTRRGVRRPITKALAERDAKLDEPVCAIYTEPQMGRKLLCLVEPWDKNPERIRLTVQRVDGKPRPLTKGPWRVHTHRGDPRVKNLA